MLRPALIASYLYCCLRTGAAPWRYFQLNAPWFDAENRLFSKQRMDSSIPPEWRLRQLPLADAESWHRWPAFLKPEWGQNGRGIHIARDAGEYRRKREELLQARIPYLVQESAPGKREFELFYVRHAAEPARPAVLSLTETVNGNGDTWPIHSIFNQGTTYLDITHELSRGQLDSLWAMMERLGPFRIARIGLRSDSLQALLKGEFRIIEINLFVPLPLALLDGRKSLRERQRFIARSMAALAEATRALPPDQPRKPIFWPMLLLNTRL
ncbi:MAG: hypothetical protein DSZ00_08355 [Gammaproteobacteria bacterium]|nr:MAG: hypothetical protein DSZ00_08355 [Gammaproteobacteria bacterium]RTZ75875.1 MAG: hypothetical protein DSZ02_02415 [Gammaproteobacteria bacterium]RTZ78691.1 MAG: hypothetical protein DSZ01_05020 [Gammaproteobacteria bacterium]